MDKANEIKSYFEKKWLADKLEKKFYNSKPGFLVELAINEKSADRNAPDYEEQLDILKKMTAIGALKIHSEEFVSHYSTTADNTRNNFFKIEILQPAFEKYLERLEQIRKSLKLTSKRITAEIQIGKLAVHYDNSLYYDGRRVKIRKQLVELCRLFMENPKCLITYEDIKERAIESKKRPHTSNTTIAKYVSELHKILRIHFCKKIIFPQREEGWRLEL